MTLLQAVKGADMVDPHQIRATNAAVGAVLAINANGVPVWDESSAFPVGAITPGVAGQVIITNSGATAAIWSSTVGLGTANLATSGLTLGNTALTGTSQYGINNQIEASAAATAALYGNFTSVTTFAGSNTTTNVYGQYIASPTKGVGSTITNRYGLYVEATAGGATINYGIYVAGGSPGIFAGGGGITLGNVGTNTLKIGGVLPDPSIAVAVTTSSLTGGSQFSYYTLAVYSSAATTVGCGIYLASTTANSSFTQVNHYGAYIDAVAKGAASTITNRYGLYVVGPTDGATINAALWVANGDVILAGSGSALATNATSGFPMIPTCAGTPSGTPTQGGTGRAAIIFDTTAIKFWAYSPVAAAWKSVALA